MRRDDLVCANCAGRVSEGRCPVCRATRDQYGYGRNGVNVTVWMVLAVLAALIAALALEARFA
ncbi:hypothetical protein KDL01_37815 [Actinospica durhamensis]|uniref:Uncharacterized protein n=1 Tax=Actinospica durhamensis TaxID=1508375 RepID=A0A941IRR1_9ACTN|nr:hypothetical protein [Actinospica durhamensis]MBR7839085.1 hypothetical protein [Actinospica durhamensis]